MLIWGAVQGVRHLRDGTGLPMLAVLGTVTAWYLGDAFYNDYANYHAKLFKPDILQSAWLEVAWFLIIFLLATPRIHRWLNARYLRRGSGVLQLFKHGVGQPVFQRQLTRLFYGCAVLWLILVVIAVIRLRGSILYFFFPFLGHNASPWSHGRIGVGFDFLSILALYLQMLIAGIFGVVAALSTNRRVCWLALGCCLLSWPYFLFGWARNMMLAVVIPGVISWVFLRLRGTITRGLVLLACFLLVNAWMGFVIANRSQMSLVTAFREKGFSLSTDEEVHHEGLNMYEELCWINTFIQQGTYTPNWGYNYFSELVNPIPRILWPGKPYIGIDYAIARGQGGADSDGSAGVYATISTGMIGQGVTNFGRILGAAFAALLMSFWVVILARLDLQIQEFGRLPLYGLGLILTFNMGRDISLLALYPFIFGALLVWWRERNTRSGVRLLVRKPNQSKSRLKALRQQRMVPRRALVRRWKLNLARQGHGNNRPLVASDASVAKVPAGPSQTKA